MQKLLGLILLLVGTSGAAMAIGAPEIGPASGVSAIALLAGAVLVIRGRRK
jgi:predicted O-methyltransferase YrrM